MPLTFIEATHEYFLDGEPLLSVSRVLELAGIHAPVFYDEATANLAAQRGTALHRATELLELGTLDWATVDPIVLPYVRCYERFLREYSLFQVDAREQRVYHSTLRYGTTLDRSGVLSAEPSIVELKTSAKVEPWMGVQLAFHAMADRRADDTPMNRRHYQRVVLHLQPDTVRQYHLVPFNDPADFAAAEHAVGLARWVQEKLAPKPTKGDAHAIT